MTEKSSNKLLDKLIWSNLKYFFLEILITN